jgi:hypothetical protein
MRQARARETDVDGTRCARFAARPLRQDAPPPAIGAMAIAHELR